MKITAALKVGFLSILSLLILILGIMWLKGRSISMAEKIEVKFHDIDGMRAGSAVRMMGMRIGQVDEIVPVIDGENSHIIVKFVINEPNVEILNGSKISIQQSGIIGEKFLEITPPFSKTIYVPLRESFKGQIAEGTSVELLAGGEYINIGEVKEAEIVDSDSAPPAEKVVLKTAKAYKIKYFISIPDIDVPITAEPRLVSYQKGKYKIRFTPPEGIEIKAPEKICKYTIVEPLRMQEFLDIQLEAAIALKQTNDKITKLFTEKFMDDIRYTFENTKDLSEKASIIMDQVAVIVDSSKEDIQMLIASAGELSNNMIDLSNNVNEIVADPQFKEDLITTADAIKVTSEQFSILLEESKLQDSLLNINSTSKNVSELAQYVNDLTKDQEFNQTMEETVVNLNNMMVNLAGVAESLDELTVQEKDRLKAIIQDSSEASANIKEFSKKLNQRFLLLRLMFNK